MNKNPLADFDQFYQSISGDLAKTTIGMGRMFDGVRTALGAYDSYPPFNFEQLDDSNYRVTFALAGFTKDDLDITVKDNWLTIEGNKKDEEADPESTAFYHHRGIANRSFKRVVQLATDIVVTEASMKDGLLTIDLEQAEDKKTKTIKIK